SNILIRRFGSSLPNLLLFYNSMGNLLIKTTSTRMTNYHQHNLRCFHPR
ncbi:unnamed protein product, partial [Linum tenue]